jgi:hypothetical protein
MCRNLLQRGQQNPLRSAERSQRGQAATLDMVLNSSSRDAEKVCSLRYRHAAPDLWRERVLGA